ncbi:MAG: hypothetical protein R2852_06570 [Bacteroidia bacterium]
MRALLLYSVFILLFLSCRKDEYENNYTPIGREYSNLDLNSHFIYNVTEVVYDDFTNSIDTSEYQIKEYNESTFKDNLGRDAVRIDRYKRNNDTADWIYENTWYAVNDVQKYERVENNIRYLKLSFPITIDAVWNSNSLNMENVNTVYYGMMHRPYTLDTFSFDSVVSVETNPIINGFRERAYKEIYAKNIGLIYKNYVYIDKAGLLQKGIRRTYKLIEYGK